MLEKLQRLARSVRVLKTPLLLLGAVCLALAVTIVLRSRSHADDRLLIPSVLGFLWALTFATFITTFQQVPGKAAPSERLLRRLGHSLTRLWQWIIGLLFLAASLALAAFTFRLIFIWFKDYN